MILGPDTFSHVIIHPWSPSILGADLLGLRLYLLSGQQAWMRSVGGQPALPFASEPEDWLPT